MWDKRAQGRDYCEISGISGMFSGFATIDCAYIYAREGLEETNETFFEETNGFLFLKRNFFWKRI